MAIQWGSWSYSGGNGMRVGIDVSVSSVNHNSSSVTFTYRVYTQNQYNYNNPSGPTITYSGSYSGSSTTSFSNTQGAGAQTLRATKTYTRSYGSSEYGSSPGSVSFGAAVSGMYNGSTPSKSVSTKIPARPYAKPAAPSNVNTVRNNDGRSTTSWSRNATSGEPYSSQTVQRALDASGPWSTVATVSGSATSWVDNGLSANRYYRYRVRANNSKGSSGYAYGDGIRTSPAAPSNVVAAVISGNRVRVRFKVNKSYAAGAEEIQRSAGTGSGSGWTTVATGIQETGEWIDTDPLGGTNQYRVREVVESQGQTLTSSWALSNDVSTEVPPAAPTNLKPDGQIFDGDQPITLSWQHNPGLDGADQSAFRIERAIVSQPDTWTFIVTEESDASSWTATPGTFANGDDWRWRVHTKGVHPDWSPNSAGATIIASTTPTVTLTAPADGETVTSLPIVAEWVFNQDEGLLQAGWQGEVRNSDGTVVSSTNGSAQGSWSVPLSAVLEDGQSYTLRVRARANTIWSDWDETGFTVNLLPPAEASIVPSFDPESGTMVLDLHVEDPIPDVSNDVDTVTVQRRIDGGPWVTLFDGITFDDSPDTTVLDTTPSLKGVMEYRLVVTSISPSTAVTEPVQIETLGVASTIWGFLSYGEGFTTILRGAGNPSLSDSPDRARGAMAAAGRRFPILLVGDQRTRTRSVSLRVVWDELPGAPGPASTDQEWIDAGLDAETVCWRDWRGVRIFGRLDGMQVTPLSDDKSADVSFSVEQTDFDEGV